MHVGFKEAYFHIRREALSSVVNAMFMLRLTAAKRKREDQKGTRKPNSKGQGQSAITAPSPLQLVFCGHSLGGVLAALLAYDISLNLEYILRAISLELRIELEANKDEGGNAPVDEAGGDGHQAHVSISTYTFGAPRVGNEAFCRKLASRLHTLYRVELDGDVITAMPPHMAQAGRQVLVDPHGAGNLIVNPSAVERNLLANHHHSVTKHTIDRYRSCLERCFTQEEFELYVNSSFGARLDRLTAIEKALAERGMQQSRRQSEVPDWMF